MPREVSVPDWRDEARYGIYEVTRREQRLVATCEDKEAIGVALVQLDDDYREAEADGAYPLRTPRGRIGVLDGHEGRWIVLPYG